MPCAPTGTGWPPSPRQRPDQGPAGPQPHPQRPGQGPGGAVQPAQRPAGTLGSRRRRVVRPPGLQGRDRLPAPLPNLGGSRWAGCGHPGRLLAPHRLLRAPPRGRAAGPAHRCPTAGISPLEQTGRAVCVASLLDAIEVLAGREAELQAEIVEQLELHADRQVLVHLPKAGHGVRAARLLAEIGDARARFPTRKPWPPRAGSPRSPGPRAKPARWASVGPATSSCATP
jgi:hypothetical protein